MKKYIAVHKKDWSECEIVNFLIDVKNVTHNYTPQTYWEPGDDSIDYEILLDEKFNNVVQVMELYFYGEQADILELPWAAVVDKNTYCFTEAENWEEILELLGWVFFDNKLNDEYDDDKESVVNKINDWVSSVADEKAWEIINDKC